MTRNQAAMDFLCSGGKLSECAVVTFSTITSPNEEDHSSTLETRKGHVGMLLNENQLFSHVAPTNFAALLKHVQCFFHKPVCL